TPAVAASTASVMLNENGSLGISGVSVSPATGDEADPVTVTLSVGHGTLHVGAFTGVTVGPDGGTVAVSGLASDVTLALQSLTYTPTGEYEGGDTLHVTATSTDGGAAPSAPSAEATVAITVNGVAETPVTSTPAAKTTAENVAVGLTGLTIAPGDPGTIDNGDIFNVTLSVGHGTLSVGTHAGLSGTFTGASITFSGSLASVTAALADNNITYAPTNNFVGSDTLHFQATSTEEASVGGNVSAATADHSALITVQATDLHWKGGTHDWDIAGQWTPSGAAPTSDNNAFIDAFGFYAVTVDQGGVAHSLTLNDAFARVQVDSTLTLGGSDHSGGNLTIAAGTFVIDSGGTLKDIGASAVISGPLTNNGTIEVAAGSTLEITNAVSTSPFSTGTFKIDAGATLQLDAGPSLGFFATQNVTFAGSGTLILKDPANFHGIISDSGGSLTTGDVLDLVGFDTNATVSYSGFKSGGFVTVSETNHTTVSLQVGANSTHWSTPVSDGHGGILIHDPPADSGVATPDTGTTAQAGQPVAGVVMHDPGPAPPSGSENFAFNFNGAGQGTVTDFHPAAEQIELTSPIATQVGAIAMQDDGHGGTIFPVYANDPVTLAALLKAQAHTPDFHV
ncbi:MAG: large repetitive protein, partial [Bradyrhizobium sp.]|nr:large repetitive protein [Bradyrhizobium sp.]